MCFTDCRRNACGDRGDNRTNEEDRGRFSSNHGLLECSQLELGMQKANRNIFICGSGLLALKGLFRDRFLRTRIHLAKVDIRSTLAISPNWLFA